LLAPAAYYLGFCAPGLAWLDSGEFAATSHALGTAHPPGHPLYTLLSRCLAYALPGSVAFRYNLVSAIFALAALAAARALFTEMLAWLSREDPRSPSATTRVCAVAGALVLAFVPPFADQALRAEVYTLGFLLATLLVWSCLRALTVPAAARRPMLAAVALFAGLGLTVHNLTVVLLSPLAAAACAAALPSGWRERGRDLARAAGAFALGTSPYVLRSARSPYLDLSHAQGPARLLAVFTAAPYQGAFHGREGAVDLAANLAPLWDVTLGGVYAPVLVLAAAGIAVVAHRDARVLLALLAAALVPALGVLGQREIHPANPDHGAYVFPTLLVAALLAAAALRAGAGFVERTAAAHVGRRGMTAAAALFAAVLPASQLLTVHTHTAMHESTTAHAHAALLAAVLPPDAVVLASNDEVGFPLMYVQVAEGRRLDVAVLSALTVLEPGGRRAARAHWPDRIPPPGRIELPRTVTSHRSPVIDAIVSYAGRRSPVVWDFHDGRTVDASQLVPFHHLALFVPTGVDRRAYHARRGDAALALGSAFNAFLLGHPSPPCDAYSRERLAMRTLARAALLYSDVGDDRAAVAATNTALLLAPDRPLLVYNRGVFLERAGHPDRALLDYRRALELGWDPSRVRGDVERLSSDGD
jgi:hypothetical protein